MQVQKSRCCWQALEGNFELILANLYQVKTYPGARRMPVKASRIDALVFI